MLAIKHECYYMELKEALNEATSLKDIEVLEAQAEQVFICPSEKVLWLCRFREKARMRALEIELMMEE